MNEFAIITALLAKKGDDIGADSKTLKLALGINERDDGALHQIMDAYARHVFVMGLTIERNPLDGQWFLATNNELSTSTVINPFHGNSRLASTLLAILLETMACGKTPLVEQVRRTRNVKDVKQDLKDLQAMGLVQLVGNEVHVTNAVGYYIDLHAFLERFTSKQAEHGE